MLLPLLDMKNQFSSNTTLLYFLKTILETWQLLLLPLSFGPPAPPKSTLPSFRTVFFLSPPPSLPLQKILWAEGGRRHRNLPWYGRKLRLLLASFTFQFVSTDFCMYKISCTISASHFPTETQYPASNRFILLNVAWETNCFE